VVLPQSLCQLRHKTQVMDSGKPEKQGIVDLEEVV
jgi:hypothetical protein